MDVHQPFSPPPHAPSVTTGLAGFVLSVNQRATSERLRTLPVGSATRSSARSSRRMFTVFRPSPPPTSSSTDAAGVQSWSPIPLPETVHVTVSTPDVPSLACTFRCALGSGRHSELSGQPAKPLSCRLVDGVSYVGATVSEPIRAEAADGSETSFAPPDPSGLW